MTFSFEPRPPPEASGYFAAKKLKPTFRWGQVWREEHANAFTIAKMTQLDLLAVVQASLQDALDQGTPYEAWAKTLTPTLQKAGWWGKKEVINPSTGKSELVQLGSPRRLKLIYQANLASARAAGQWERAQRTKGVAPYFLYMRSSSVDPRDEHLTWVGTLLPVDHPWWSAHFPPNGWRCKCQVRQVTTLEFVKLGGKWVMPAVYPPVAYRRRLDDGTKAAPVMVPGGIDPGWDTSPGLARTTTILDAFARSLAKARRAGVPKDLTDAIQQELPLVGPLGPITAREPWPWDKGNRFDGQLELAPIALDSTFEGQLEPDEGMTRRLLAGVPKAIPVGGRWSSGYKTVRFSASTEDDDWSEYFQVSRIFSRDSDDRLVVEHSHFEIPNAFQQGGNGKAMMRASLALYDELGIERVEVSTGLTQGGYVWARYGFAAENSERMRERIKGAARSRRDFDEDDVDLIEDAVDQASPLTLMQAVAAVRNEDDRALGYELLVDISWKGYIDLTSSAHRVLLARALK
jgi:Phage Mu protein F like protein